MAWRTVFISNPAKLKLKQSSVVIEQITGETSVPLEDIVAIIIENPQVILTAPILSACADNQVALISVDKTGTPNGIFLSYLPHSRALKIMRQQLEMSIPAKKRLWQTVVKQKLVNQALLLRLHKIEDKATHLELLAKNVKSGDTDNHEAYASQLYFPALFGKNFSRNFSVISNSALNYGYAIVRSAMARSLVGYGFLTAFGIHHKNEQNAFNLADDLMEPYRPVVDALVLKICPENFLVEDLDVELKAKLVGVLHQDISSFENEKITGKSTVLSLINTTVISFGQYLLGKKNNLVLPILSEKK